MVIKSPTETADRVSRAQLKTESIKSLSLHEPTILEPGTSLSDALRAMHDCHGEPILVTSAGRLAGVLTERDVLMKVLGRDLDPAATQVDQVMTADPDALSLDSTVGDALQHMDQGGFRTVPLVDDQNAVTGILRQEDIVAFVAEAFPQEILNLPPRPHQVMDEEGA